VPARELEYKSGSAGSCQVQEERSLIDRAQKGDQGALTQIYEENFDRIYRYVVLKIGDRTEAEDITQQVFVNCVKSISHYKYGDTPFKAWLYRIAHNQIVDHLRRRSKRPTAELDESLVDHSREGDPEALAELSVQMETVVKATKNLTKAQQEVISLRFTSDLSVAEVAKIMNKSEGAIKALQHSAVAALRKELCAG
jgi:RNA polymerase sigma-70 factor (ECF subfamily)